MTDIPSVSGAGGEKRWRLAMAWAEEPDRLAAPPAAAPEPAPPAGDEAEDVARELGLGSGLSPDQLSSRWRDFLWRNHPDRQPAAARSRANVRVAIANALYDRARRERSR